MEPQLPIGLVRLIGAIHAALPDRLSLLGEAVSGLLEAWHRDSSVGTLRSLATRYSERAGMPLDLEAGERVLQWLERPGHHLLVQSLPSYPPALAEVAKAPPVLFVDGRPELLSGIQIAVVGSRRASAAGCQIARTLAGDLARAGFAITSGLASGIDAAAHRGALEAGGYTVAVFGSGIDVIYPPAHRALARQVAASGALVSEFPLGCRPARHSFPRRNRVISGLASGTLVVEAALGSGSLITAREALEQGREVFAVPGSILNPLSAGPHWLLRNGAALVESAVDVLQELPGHVLQASNLISTQTIDCKISDAAKRVLSACGFEPTSFDALVARSGLTPPELSSILVALDIQGWVRAEAGGTYVLLKPLPESA